MQLELSFPVIFKMLITGFGLAQKVSVVELFFQITTTEVDVICAVLSSVNSIRVSKVRNILPLETSKPQPIHFACCL